MKGETVLAVDLGASSGRVVEVTLSGGHLSERVVHRFPNSGVRAPDGSLRWDWNALTSEVRTGLDRGIDAGNTASIGIDAWGVDYGLLDEHGRLLADPYSYRDSRTSGWRELIDRIGARHIYEITGIQFMALNTLCQIAVHDRSEMERARWLLLIPELMVHALTGEICAERTSASTTQFLDARKGIWAADLVEEAGVDPAILPDIGPAGTVVGEYRGVPVRLIGGHDTASGVAAVPYKGGRSPAFLSSGTWSLLGVEVSNPVLSDDAMQSNFTNEAGVYGNIRLLRNVMGLWMLDECRRKWDMDIEETVRLAEDSPPGVPLVDATDERFLNPPDMEEEIRAAAPDLGESRGAVARCVIESLADSYAAVVDKLTAVTGTRPGVIHVIGGGSRISLLNRLTASACEIPVLAGPDEATSLGNAIIQMVALGWFRDHDEARAAVVNSVQLEEFLP